MPRPLARSYRLGPDTLDLIEQLRRTMLDDLGRPRSASDVVRLALQRLALDVNERTPKKSRKKSPHGIDTGDTR